MLNPWYDNDVSPGGLCRANNAVRVAGPSYQSSHGDRGKVGSPTTNPVTWAFPAPGVRPQLGREAGIGRVGGYLEVCMGECQRFGLGYTGRLGNKGDIVLKKY